MNFEGSAGLRKQLVEELRNQGSIESNRVALAFESVPREAFVPFVNLNELYKDVAIATRWDRLGRATSSSSQPAIMALMLEMLRLEQGHNVLEIGAATGYNAALLRELVGAGGRITTVDVQPDLAVEARQHLESAGYRGIEVIAGDGRRGYSRHAPYDRIIATASCGDIPMDWWHQLRPEGQLVLPYRWNNAQAVFALRRTSEGFETERAVIGGFMHIHGPRGMPADSTLLGPRKDVAVSPARLPRRLDKEALFRLLIDPPRSDPQAAIGSIFGSDGPEARRRPWEFRCFLACRVDSLLEISTRNAVYGFRYGLALADTSAPSLAVLTSGGPPPRPGERPSPPQLLSFGEDVTYRRIIEVAEEFIALDHPGLERLRLSLTRSSSGRRWRRAFSYAGPGA